MKPFIKWLGGKRTLAQKILNSIPWCVSRYFEPMVGAGAVFWKVRRDLPHLPCTISDQNLRLVRTYRALRDDVDKIIEELSQYPIDKDFFLELRKKEIDSQEDFQVAAWLIYLNKTAFNGLYRVNKRGGFNAPWGYYKNPTVCDPALLRACSEGLQGVEIQHGNFDYTVRNTEANDFVYFDPPYLPETPDGFSSYTSKGFGVKDHERLRDLALDLRDKGVFILISNSDTGMTTDIYDHRFCREVVTTKRTVAANVKSRGKITELLLW